MYMGSDNHVKAPGKELKAYEHDFDGTAAVTLVAGGYQATVLPAMGGNLVSFDDTQRNLHFLRTPSKLQALKEKAVLFGIPVLFPPNRYEDGTFTVGGKRYQFPINEPETHNHLHGFLKDVVWDVTALGNSDDAAFVEITKRINDQDQVYQTFPHDFTISIRYTLSENGLESVVRVENHGTSPMPLMLGFHTTLNAPFHSESSQDDYTIFATIGERWEMTQRMLPTGSFQPLAAEEQQLKMRGASPFFAELDNHYTAVPQGGRNFVALTDRRLGIRLVYDVGLKYKQWMLFNNFARGGFICPEPQTSVVNAPNTGLPDSESGLLVLQPSQVWTETSRLFAENL